MRFDNPAYMGAEELIAYLETLICRLENGESIECEAFRLFKADGTWEDVALGGTAAEKARALAALRATDD